MPSPPDEPLLLVDESLSPAVAKALESVGYRAVDVRTAFGRQQVTDPEIIRWLARQPDPGAVWIHADDNAKRHHKALMLAHGTKTLWVYRPKGKMSTRDQLRVLAYVLPDYLERIRQARSRSHFRVDTLGNPPNNRVRLQEYSL